MYEVESCIRGFHVYCTCGRLTLESNLIVFTIVVIVKIPSLLQFRKTVKRLVMCSLSTEKHLYVVT